LRHNGRIPDSHPAAPVFVASCSPGGHAFVFARWVAALSPLRTLVFLPCLFVLPPMSYPSSPYVGCEGESLSSLPPSSPVSPGAACLVSLPSIASLLSCTSHPHPVFPSSSSALSFFRSTSNSRLGGDPASFPSTLTPTRVAAPSAANIGSPDSLPGGIFHPVDLVIHRRSWSLLPSSFSPLSILYLLSPLASSY